MDAFSSSSFTPNALLPAATPHVSRRPLLLPISAVRTEETPPMLTQAKPRTRITTTGTPPNTTSTAAATPTKPKQHKTPITRRSKTTTTTYTPRAPQTPSLPAMFCNAMDGLINNFVDPPLLRPSVDPRHVLSDNFAPVGELPPTPCPVVRGSVPACLGGGAYIRNGPNPQHLPRGPYHLFDGDGMLHSLLLPAGGGTAPATLSSRFVRTYRYLLERDAGAPVLPNVFSAFHGPAGVARGAVTAARVLTGLMNPLEGVGLANTSLAFFADRLYAFGESDLPYAVHLSPRDGELSTMGRCDFGGRLFMGMTAHPKKDPATGELFAFRYGPVPPFVTYFRFDRAGNKLPDVPIFSVTQPSFLHDFAITQRYAVFGDIQIVMKPMDMVLGGGAPVGSDRAKVPRIGVLPRYAESEADMRWFEVPGFNMIHALNAWDEDDGETLILIAPNVLSIEHALERTELVHSCVEKVRVDLKTGTVSRTPLSAGNLDFGVIHPATWAGGTATPTWGSGTPCLRSLGWSSSTSPRRAATAPSPGGYLGPVASGASPSSCRRQRMGRGRRTRATWCRTCTMRGVGNRGSW